MVVRLTQIEIDDREFIRAFRAQALAVRNVALDTLTYAANKARQGFVDAAKADLDNPVAFTTNKSGYLVRPAKNTPEAAFLAKDRQAAYLQYVVGGGERHPGDPGTSPNYAWLPTRGGPRSRAGGLPHKATEKMAAQSGPGGRVFFGTIAGSTRALLTSQQAGLQTNRGGGFADDGTVGFWLRPRRTKARTKVVNGKRVLARPSDPNKQVRNKGVPILLAKAQKETIHRSIIDMRGIADQAFAEALSKMPAKLNSILQNR
jgi:hypothetical protein